MLDIGPDRFFYPVKSSRRNILLTKGTDNHVCKGRFATYKILGSVEPYGMRRLVSAGRSSMFCCLAVYSTAF